MKLLTKILFLLLIPHILLNAASSFSGERLKDACLDFLRESLGDDKEITLMQSPEDLNFKQDKVRAIINQEVSKQVGINYVEINFLDDEANIIKTMKVYYRYSYEKVMPVAIRSIRKGEVITEKDFVLRKMKLTIEEETAAANTADLIGKKADENIPKGALIKTASLETGRKVNRGDKVVVIANADGLIIRATAIALSDAKAGQQIRVQRDDKQILQGLLNEEGNVELIKR